MPESTKAQIEHDCPHCGERYIEDCLKDCDEHIINVTKSRILLAAGLGAVGIVVGAFSIHAYALYNGKQGIGIDLNQLLYACLAAVGGIILWAFPKAGSK